MTNFADCWHPVMHASEPREVINVRQCELCEGDFLPDIGQQQYCGRELCRQVRMFWAKEKRHRAHREEI